MLNADELKHGPGPRLAFLPLPDSHSLAEVMVAFANTEGGIIVLGLETNGQPYSGAALSDDDVQKLLEAAENLFNPGIVIEEWEELDIDDEDFFQSESLLAQGRIVISANETPVSGAPADLKPSAASVIAPESDKTEALSVVIAETPDTTQKTSLALQTPDTPSLVVMLETAVAPTAQDQGTPQQAALSSSVDEPSVLDSKDAARAAPNDAEVAAPETLSKTEAAETSLEAAAPVVVTQPQAEIVPAEDAAAAAPDQAVISVSSASVSPEKVTAEEVPAVSEATVPVSPTQTETAASPSDSAVSASAVPVPQSPQAAPDISVIIPATSVARVVSDSSAPTLPSLYAVKIPRSIELHALNDGRVLIRSGARNRPLGGQEILRLASAKGTGEFEAEIVPGASQADFSRRLIDEYLLKRAERTKRPFSGSIDEMLLEIGALTPDRHPTAAGILLFSEYPQKWLPQSSVIFARFVGTQPRGESGMAGYIRREEITGPLPRLIESAWNLVWSEMAVSAVVSGLEREERAEYPQFAVREAIVNSICHRDYRLRGRRIELRMYSDRLEVISPGGLPGFITVENIKDEHFSRNPRIVNGLFQWGYIEELGLGIDRMIEVMEQAGREPPHFDARPYSFAVTLNNEREKHRPLDWIRSANHRQARAMQYIREHGSITNREYRILCAGVSAETLRLDLAGMVDRGQLIKVGSKKGTHYLLRDKDVPSGELP